MRFAIPTIATLAIVAAVATQTPQASTPVIKPAATYAGLRYSEESARQLRAVSRQIVVVRRLTWACQDDLGETRTVAYRKEWQLPPSARVRAAVARKWVRLARTCQKERRRRTIPLTADYVVSTALADRVWPGSRSWLLSCAASEGGWGGWVWNRQGSGAGGNLQFMRSTWENNAPAAFGEARRRGFIIDRAAYSYFHPLGQAIVGAYMLSIGQRRQWAGSGC